MATEECRLSSLDDALRDTAAKVNKALDRLLAIPDGPEARVAEAMRYATLGGGKRLRSFLVVASADLFEVARSASLRVAAVVELVHTYSLVHDDLPCMDDDDVRRGQPSAHVQYDEATAVLAGDALLTLAFETLATPETAGSPDVRCQLIGALAAAAGHHGMVGGQMMDLVCEQAVLDIGAVTRLQRLKTGELIAFACEAGAILGNAPVPLRQALHAYAHDLGLAFQIIDDLLDVEGRADVVGKPVGGDTARGKATFVSLLGVDRARQQAKMLAQQAAAHLEPFAEKAELLRDVTYFVINRER